MIELLEGELTYEIIGYIYQAYNQLGYGFQEKYYHRAFAETLNKASVVFDQEVGHPITLKDSHKIIGRYYLDFVIRDLVVVEWKVSNELHEQFVNQVLAYLKSTKYKIGLIAQVTSKGMRIKRLVS